MFKILNDLVVYRHKISSFQEKENYDYENAIILDFFAFCYKIRVRKIAIYIFAVILA